jgi:hypothetical protein
MFAFARWRRFSHAHPMASQPAKSSELPPPGTVFTMPLADGRVGVCGVWQIKSGRGKARALAGSSDSIDHAPLTLDDPAVRRILVLKHHVWKALRLKVCEKRKTSSVITLPAGDGLPRDSRLFFHFSPFTVLPPASPPKRVCPSKVDRAGGSQCARRSKV